MSDFDVIVFGKKSLSDLLKDVYDQSKKKDKQINDLVDQLKELINNVGDGLQLAPLIGSYVDLGIKNDEHIIKMLQIAQKAAARMKEEGEDKDFTAAERDALQKEWGAVVKDMKSA